MLLVTMTYTSTNGADVTKHISNEFYAAPDQYWDAGVVSLSNVDVALSKPYGGRVVIAVGSIELLPSVFDSDIGADNGAWPPPDTIEITIAIMVDDVVTEIVRATGHLNDLDRDTLSYDLYTLEPTFTVRSMKVEDTLYNVFLAFAQTFTPAFTLDVSAAPDAAAIDISFTSPNNDMLLIDVFADIAEFTGHFFYIDYATSTVVLVSMDATVSVSVSLSEFDIFPSRYAYPPPIKSIVIGESSIPGDYPYGVDLNANNILAPDAGITLVDTSGGNIGLVNKCYTDIDGNPLSIEYDPDKLYRITVTYERSADGEIYTGFACMSGPDTPLSTDGTNSYFNQHYIAYDISSAGTEKRTITGYITGHSTPGTMNLTVYGNTISTPIHAQTGATHIRPLFYDVSGTAGEPVLYYMAIDEMELAGVATDSDGASVARLFEYKADYFDPNEWHFPVGSSASVVSPVQDMADKVLASARKPEAELHLPVDAVYNIGQQLTWVDESVAHPVSGSMHIRSIMYNFDAHEIVYKGEGEIN